MSRRPSGSRNQIPMELVWGVVREPPAPRYGHQTVVTSLSAVLHQHVHERRLGVVCVSPIDVALDAQRVLVVQPDLVFVSAARREIVRDRHPGCAGPRGRGRLAVKRAAGLHRQARLVSIDGVRECWLVDPVGQSVTVVPLADGGGRRRTRRFTGTVPVGLACTGDSASRPPRSSSATWP